MPRKEIFIGIGVAKDVLDIAVRPTGEQWRVANDEVGITDLVKRLRAAAPDADGARGYRSVACGRGWDAG